MARKISEDTIKILDNGLEHIKSVPYSVSLRWLFYRLLQEGTYSDKSDYINFKSITARYRKKFFRGWAPDTLIDDTRQIHYFGDGVFTKEHYINNLVCELDKFQNQDYVLMIWFEARAMYKQLRYYTKNIPLVPFGGDPSIYFKHKIAKDIEKLKEKHNKPIVVLYFGDCDKKGTQIYKSALKDIRSWCNVDFDFKYCGLTLEQATNFNLPENFEKPEQYQWEALSDKQAMAIITDYVSKYQDCNRFKEIEKKEQDILKDLKGEK